jgi:glycosyltransferase involved in cell wall biosynthesis
MDLIDGREPAAARRARVGGSAAAGDATAPTVRRVLMTADAVGGVWRYTIDLAAALQAKGVAVTVAVMGPAPGDGQRLEADRAGIAMLARAYDLEWMDDPWSGVERAGHWLLALERTLRPDVVHLNGYSHAALPWHVPAVVVAHSCVRTWWRAVKREPAPAAYDRYRDAVAAGLRAANAVIAPTAAMLEALGREYGDVNRRTRVIPNGGAAAPAVRCRSGPKQELVFAAGRVWDEAKNLAAIGAIAGRVRWPVYVAGECRRPGGRACELPGGQLLGRLSGSDLSDWYARASIYALPARYEPFGLSVLEAAAAGCALVLGDIPSLRENWSDAALFVAPDDHEALRAAVQSLIDDRALRERLARRAEIRAAAFTIGGTATSYISLYRELTT